MKRGSINNAERVKNKKLLCFGPFQNENPQNVGLQGQRSIPKGIYFQRVDFVQSFVFRVELFCLTINLPSYLRGGGPMPPHPSGRSRLGVWAALQEKAPLHVLQCAQREQVEPHEQRYPQHYMHHQEGVHGHRSGG